MKASEIDEGFRDWFGKKELVPDSGPQLMKYPDIEMIQSVDRLARGNTKDVYNLQSKYGKIRFVYVKYPNAYELRMVFPDGKSKSFKFKTASEFHKIFYGIMDMLQSKNGT